MIARIWRGTTAAADADEYLEFVRGTGGQASRTTSGNCGFFVLRRPLGELAEFLTVSLWESRDVIRAFAGETIDQAVLFPEDQRYLVEHDLAVAHYDADDLGTTPFADGELGRLWHGWTTPGDNTEAYEAFLRAEMLPGIHRIVGYRGAFLLRRDVGDEVEFVTLTRWDSMAAVKAFAGDDHEHAVVLPEARRVLARFDERSAHYDTFV
jgi:heme-degrading monooxygenase HmoA